MNTFKGAFSAALRNAGYTPHMVNEILTVWRAKDQYLGSTSSAVVTVVKGHGEKAPK